MFSTFPNGWPGVGLLLLRISLCLALTYLGTASVWRNPSESVPLAQNIVAVLAGLLLLGGLWTPVAGVLVALDQTGIALSLPPGRADTIWLHLLLAANAISVAMLGPGAWSIDARLFGRKRLDIDRMGGR